MFLSEIYLKVVSLVLVSSLATSLGGETCIGFNFATCIGWPPDGGHALLVLQVVNVDNS